MLESSDITLVTADQSESMDRERSSALEGAGEGSQRLVIQSYWGGVCPDEMRKHEGSIQNGCVLRGLRVIVGPRRYHEAASREDVTLHTGFNPARPLQESEGKTRQIKDHNKKTLVQNRRLSADPELYFGPEWILGILKPATGPVSYKVMLGDGTVVRGHVDEIHAHHHGPEKMQ